MEQTLTCISCPVGCRMKVVTENGKFVSISGNACKRGEVYGKQESIAPKRMVTAVIPVKNRRMPLSVKTKESIPKQDINKVMKALTQVEVSAPVGLGQVIIANVVGSGVDIVATKPID